MLTPDQIPGLAKAMSKTGRVLIISAPGAAKMSAAKNALMAMKDEFKIIPTSVDGLFEEPTLLDSTDNLIVLTDASYALKGDGGSEAFLRFMSIVQRRDYKAIVVAPVELDTYDSHAAQYCMNVRIS